MTVLAYHMVDSHFDWGITRVTPNQFAKQIRAAVEHGLEFCTARQYADFGQTQNRICITFDDGYESVYHYAFPVLRQFGIPATVFINPLYIGQRNTWDVNIGWLKFSHLNWDQVRALAQAGWEIGSHGLTHRDLTRLDDAELNRELSCSRSIIERRIGCPVRSISYPFGNADSRVCEMAAEAGYSAGFVMSRSSGTQMDIARTGIYLLDRRYTFLQKAQGNAAPFYRFLQAVLDYCSDGTVLVKQGLWKQNKKS